MIKISARRAALVAVPAALVGSAAFWLGASAVPASGHPKPDTIELAATTGEFAIVQHGTPGPALHLGDQIVSNDTLSRSGKKVGTDGVVCEVVKITEDRHDLPLDDEPLPARGPATAGRHHRRAAAQAHRAADDSPWRSPVEPVATSRPAARPASWTIPDETEQITIQLNRGL